jgi:hypothetical protein
VPDGCRFVVILVDADVEPVFVQLQIPGEKFPGIGYRFLLEVIAEGKVAEHLEKGVMPGGATDIFQVVVFAAGPNAFLRTAGPGVVPVLQTEEQVLELVHAGIGEQQRRVILRYEVRTGDDRMASLNKKLQETFPDFFSSHCFSHSNQNNYRLIRCCLFRGCRVPVLPQTKKGVPSTPPRR